MAQLFWSADLATGIREIDVQHQRIVQFINSLHEARLKEDMAAVAVVIEEAVDYTLSHFAFEEALMQEAGYPFAGPHKRVHELFTRKVGEFQARLQGGEDISGELHTVLSRWLFNHIRNDDAGYVAVVKKHMNASGDSQQQMKSELKSELLREMESRSAKKGWFRRLFGG